MERSEGGFRDLSRPRNREIITRSRNYRNNANHDRVYNSFHTQIAPHFQLREIKCNLFDVPDSFSLAHCVAEDMHMGRGIAVEFREKFRQVHKLLNQRKITGQVAVLQVRGRYIYYLVTKKFSSSKPSYKSLESSLKEMCRHVQKFNVKEIAMPRIGCGLDRLYWPNVYNLIWRTFKHLNIRIYICYIENYIDNFSSRTYRNRQNSNKAPRNYQLRRELYQ